MTQHTLVGIVKSHFEAFGFTFVAFCASRVKELDVTIVQGVKRPAKDNPVADYGLVLHLSNLDGSSSFEGRRDKYKLGLTSEQS